MGWYNFTAWALNPLKTPRIPYLSAPPAVWAQEWFAQVSLGGDTLFLILFVLPILWCISLWCVLGVLSYGHKKRIFSFHLSVSFLLSYWYLSPIPYSLLSELLVSLVLRKLNSLIFIFIALDMNRTYAIGYRKRYRNRGVPLMNWLLLSTNHKWFSTNFTIHFILLLFILFF